MIGEAKKMTQDNSEYNEIVNEQPSIGSNKSHKLFDTIFSVVHSEKFHAQVKLQLKQELVFEKQYLLI